MGPGDEKEEGKAGASVRPEERACLRPSCCPFPLDQGKAAATPGAQTVRIKGTTLSEPVLVLAFPHSAFCINRLRPLSGL